MKQLIYLMRHAHIDTQACMIGRKDLELSSLGIKQAEYWQEALKNIDFDKVYCSPLKRAKQTCEIILKNKEKKNYCILDNLCEISLGAWEGMKKEEVILKYPLLWQKRGEDFYYNSAPEGESFLDVEQRVLPAFYNICQELAKNSTSSNETEKPYINKTKHILILSHQLVNRLILADILHLDKKEIMQIPQNYACLNKISVEGEIKFIENKECPIK